MEPIYTPNGDSSKDGIIDNPVTMENNDFGLSTSPAGDIPVEPLDTNIYCCLLCCCSGGGGGGGTASLIEDDIIL